MRKHTRSKHYTKRILTGIAWLTNKLQKLPHEWTLTEIINIRNEIYEERLEVLKKQGLDDREIEVRARNYVFGNYLIPIRQILKFLGKNEIVAGEEFFYTLKYNNDSKIGISNAKIEINYPDNFVFLDSYPESNNKTNTIWNINKIPPKSNNSIKIKGYLIGAKNKSGILTANITYTPENFSSEFKKDTTLTTRINDIGINFDIDYIPTVLVGEKNEIQRNGRDLE